MNIACNIAHGNFPVVESFRQNRAGPAQYDTAQLVYYSDGTVFDLDFRNYFPAGSAMFLEGSNEDDLGEGFSKVTLDYIGLLTLGPAKNIRRVSAFGQEVSVGPVVYETTETVGLDTDGDGLPDDTAKELVETLRTIQTPSGQGDRWLITEPILGVVDTYFTTSRPETRLIGTQQTPPNAPPSPAYIWTGYGDPMRFRHPNGWVLEARDYENAFGNIYLVTDTYAFKQVASPD